MNKQHVVTLFSIFILLSAGLFVLDSQIPAYRFLILESGNVMMFLVTIAGVFMVQRQVGKTGGAFVRGVTGASFLKLMVCLTAALIYIVTNRTTLHKPSIFVLFGIYMIYTASETMMLSKLAKTSK
ncbi:MAG: hypothetical protein H7257_04505 [Taibaiella sp.]|nr:hypothetical protein [Taibaiella sp.]